MKVDPNELQMFGHRKKEPIQLLLLSNDAWRDVSRGRFTLDSIHLCSAPPVNLDQSDPARTLPPLEGL